MLDIGCGIGSFFPALREAVGPGGRVVGVDYSPRMLQRAQRRIDAAGWSNVEVIRADAGRDHLGRDEFDAAVAVSSLSATPDVHAAIRHAHAALRPKGRLFVFDLRLVPDTGPRPLVRLLRLLYRALAGACGGDVLAELRETFHVVEVLPVSSDRIVLAIADKRVDPQKDTSTGTTGIEST